MAAGIFESSNPLMSGSNSQARTLEPLEDVITDAVGFVTLKGDTRNLRILPNAWPSNALPPPTASLFSVASRNGLIAAADPSKLVIARTKDVRTDLARSDGPETAVKNLSQSMLIDLPTRVSQVVFSTDEKYLVISAVDGGGLQVYETSSIKQNNTQHAFQIPTNEIPVQALIPNPAEDQAHLFAVVLGDGKLMIVDLRSRQFVNSAQGNPVLRDNDVRCCSWSAKGKQLVAGLRDGSAVQLKPDGQVQAAIPKPPPTNDPKIDDCNLASTLWLDNNRFFNIYSSNQDTSEPRMFVVTKQENIYTFRKLATEPTALFSQLRQPPHFFISRLRDYEPTLKDALFVATTCGPDIGLVANSTTPLARDAPDTANTYSNVGQIEDSRRAQLPASVSEEMTIDEPSALGMAFDFSADEAVKRPIPQQADAIEQTPHPVPALMVLNHEGILSAWSFIYNDAIIQNRMYKGMNQAPRQPAQQASTATPTSSQPAFGQSGFSAFQTPAAAPTQPMGLGSSPWGSQQRGPAFGQSGFSAPSLGSPSQPTFGTQASPSQTPAFGSSTALGGGQKLFGGDSNTQASPFGKMAAQGSSAFSAFASNKDTNTKSPFATFNKNGETSPLFGTQSAETRTFGSSKFGQAQNQQTGWGFGQPEKKDNQLPAFAAQPSNGSTMTIGSSFGSFGKPSALGSSGASPWATPSLSNNASNGLQPNISKAQDEDADMDMDKKVDSVFDSGIAGLGFEDKKQESSKEPEKAEINEQPKQPGPTEEPKIKEEPDDDTPLPASEPSEKAVQKPSPKVEEPPLPPDPSTPLPPSPRPDRTPPKETSTTQTPVKALPDGNENETTTPKSPEPQEAKPSAGQEKEEKEEPSPAGSEPELVEAEKSIPPSPTKSVTTDVDPTINLDRAGTWPRQKSSMPPTPQKSLFGDGGIPTGSFSFGQTPTGTLSKPPVLFRPPGPESPRSPSPVRRIASPRGRGTLSPTRLASTSQDRKAFSPAPQLAPTPRPPAEHARSHLVNEITPVKSSPAPSSTPSVPPPRAPSPVPSVDFTAAQETEDRVHEELESPVKATKKLKSFIAHNDYVNELAGTSFASQIERLYRDGNSMVDTLGLNARTLQQFIKGHEELYKDGERDTTDLEPDKLESWTLIEISDLDVLQKNLMHELEANKPADVRETLLELRDIHRVLVTIRNKRTDLSRIVAESQALISDTRSLPKLSKSRAKLAPQQATLLRDLRKQYAHVQTLLAQAEDAASLLRAKIVTQEARDNGVESGPAQEIPTVEAVVNTIAKMTRMAEQKRGDVDLLESRLKKIKRERRGGSEELGVSLGRMSLGGKSGRFMTPPTPGRRSGQLESPLSSPTAKRRIRKEKRAGYGFSYTDDDDEDRVSVKREEGDDEGLVAATRALAIRNRTPQREGWTRQSGLSAVELEDVVERQANRKKVLKMFRDEVVKRGPKMRDVTK